jgi:multiple sugar transport system permease protein
MSATTLGPAARPNPGSRGRRNYARSYWLFAVPAAVVVAGVILFPWLFTLIMSVNDWKVSGNVYSAGATNYLHLAQDPRFLWAVVRTLYFTTLAVVIPMVLGIWAAVCFAENFKFRGVARTLFILPMMATPVAIALVWTMMFHPQLGVLNYLLHLAGLPPSQWVYSDSTVIPTLVMVETWQWTPLVMLIVLGGISGLPIDPYEAAVIDGANAWQMFRYITLPLVWPFIIVAAAMRVIDALKTFDTIFVITGGGPGTASETINMLLYQTAFGYYDLGYASAMVVVFFALILVVTVGLLRMRRLEQWQ